MAESLKGIYNRRHPERTDYYRIIEGSFEEFERSYPDQFEEKYGYLRTEVKKAVYSFLECGIPENGMARVRCEECGHDFFVAYSCRCRIACPSCSTKRSILSAPLIAEIFRACPCGSKQGARLLCVLLEQGVITQELINMLMCWNHHSGFNVHVRGEIAGTDGDAIENIARYMSRAAISVDRVEFNPEDNTLTVYEKKDRPSSGMQATYTIMEFMALLAAHIPSPYESLVHYYGIYSSSHRGKERRENRCNQSIKIQETKGAGKASSTWARLIHRIFEVNPLLCRKCGGNTDRCVYYRLSDHKKYTQAYRGGDRQTSSPKSENPHGQYH